MTPSTIGPPPGLHSSTPDVELLLRETNHRCGNDLQLVVSLLMLQSLRVKSDEARIALSDAADRVAILARARMSITQQSVPNLEEALRQVCEALRPYAEPRSILISLHVDQASRGFSADRITALALVVNELMTNALKHAFRERVSGSITIKLERSVGGYAIVTVDDDGLPYPDPSAPKGSGLGLGIARRLMASIDGILIVPTPPNKVFELRVPAEQVPVRR